MNSQDVITRFLAHLRQSPYHPATVKHYTEQLARFAAWLAAESIDDLRRVTRRHIDAYQITVRAEPIGRETQAIRLRAVKRLYEYLVDTGRLVVNPTEGIREVSRREALPRPVLSLDEMTRLMAAPDTAQRHGIRDRALLEVLYATGIRAGELRKTCVEDVDSDTQTLLIRHAKTGVPRVVPLGSQAVHWLTRYLTDVRPLWVKHRPERALFVTKRGEALGHARMGAILHRCRRIAAIRKAVSPHVLRHSCATHLMQAGANLRTIQELLGHSHLESTVLYTRVVPMEVKATHTRYHPGSEYHVAD
jgi:integrase/recombinase XerD